MESFKKMQEENEKFRADFNEINDQMKELKLQQSLFTESQALSSGKVEVSLLSQAEPKLNSVPRL